MTRRVFSILCAAVLFSIAGCARESTPSSPAVTLQAIDPAAAWVRDVRDAFTRAAAEQPDAARRTLGAMYARDVPRGIDPDDVAFVRVELDRERALVALDAHDPASAVVAVERALTVAEGMTRRDPSRIAALLLTAESVYLAAGRVEAAAWSRREATAIVGRDGGI